MNKGRSILTLGSIYIGTVIGAGFASGQELLQFFGKHGRLGLAGVIVSTILFCCLGASLLQMVYRKRIESFDALLMNYFSRGTSYWINCVLTLFLLIGYVVMLAGGGAILRELFSINNIFGILLMSLVCYFTFIFGVKGIAKVNNVIVPLLMLLVIFFTIMVLKNNLFLLQGYSQGPLTELKLYFDEVRSLLEGQMFFGKVYILVGWLWSSILYVSFNSLVAIVVLSTLLPFIKDQKSGKYGGIVGGLGLGLMAFMLLVNLLFHYTSVHRLEVPMIAVAGSLGSTPKNLYSILLWGAMFTTAIANGYGCIKNVVSLTKVPEGIIRILVCGVSIPLALVGFRNLVSFFYPIFGYKGLLFLILILFGRRK